MNMTPEHAARRRQSHESATQAASALRETTAAALDGLDLRARLRVIRRRFFYFIAGVIGCMIIAGVLTLYAPRSYRATATVLIDANAPEVLSGVREVYDLGAGYWASKEYYQTQYGVIRSRMVAQKVVSALGLSTDILREEIQAAAAVGLEERVSADAIRELPESLRSKLRLVGIEKARSRDEILRNLQKIDPATFLQKRIVVEPVRDSRLVRISVEYSDPDLAALVANSVVDAYINVNLDQKIDATRSAINWLTQQMQDLKNKLTASESALHEFRKANNIDSLSMEDKQTINAQTMAQLNQSLSTARAQGFALASRRDEIRRALKTGVLPDTLSEVVSNTYVQKLKGSYADERQVEASLRLRYTDKHPQVIAAHERVDLIKRELDNEINKILDMLNKEYAFSVETQGRLEHEMQRVKDEALDLGKKEIEYGRLKRERDNNLALFEVILKREKEASLTQMLKVNNVRRLDAARPPTKPVGPNARVNMSVGLLLGILFGTVLAFLVDYLDNSVKSQDQIEQIIGLPFLGLVPTIKVNGSARTTSLADRDLHLLKHPRSIVAEAWRTIRTNIMFMSTDSPAKCILVSSSGPREGKTTTVISLSVTTALLGARTLLVDTDMRRPRLHKSFGLSNDVGLSNVILGDTSLDEAIRPTELERLDILTCGPIPPNPAELLHSEAFQNVLARLKERYDRIVFDSPPLGAVSDGLVLASMVDGVVIVAEAGRSSWQATVRSKRCIQDVGGLIYGVVLNNVDLDRRTEGDYYYYKAYRYGYAAEDAEA